MPVHCGDDLFYILREAWNILNAIAEGKIESGDEKKLNALKGETMAVIAPLPV